MAVQGVNGMAIMAAFGGGVLVWSGLKGASVTGSLRSLLAGQQPTGANVHPVGTPVGAPASSGAGGAAGGITVGGNASGSAVAAAAQKYTGHCYLFGGAPGPTGKGCWDCSSFCNWVLAHDMHRAIPGGTWNPSTHGPTTLSYLGWNGATTVGHTPAAAVAGDLCVWQTHMGIALGGGNMISALDAQLGTKVTTISGGAPGFELLSVRRLK